MAQGIYGNDYNAFVAAHDSQNERHFDVEKLRIEPDSQVLIRVMIDNVGDILNNICTVHPVRVGNVNFDNRYVNCIRTANEPLEQCPLCSAGVDVKERLFVKVIAYNEQTHEAQACIWDLPTKGQANWVQRFKNYLDNYGPLSNIFCKATRTGKGLDTKYDLIPNVNPQMYNDSTFPRKDDAFDNFNLVGSFMLMDKNAGEMMEYVNTGKFPEVQKDSTPTPTSYQTAPVGNPYENSVPVDSVPNYQPVPETPAVAYQPTPEPIPNGFQQPYTSPATPVDTPAQMERPVRYTSN